LKDKIGVMDNNGRVLSGFCRPVLDKCRRYTYGDGQYVDNNTVVKSYMERTMMQIKAAQQEIIADYAKTCLIDVSACYNGQITNSSSYGMGTGLSPKILKPVLMGACRGVALSCSYAVFSDSSTPTRCPTSGASTAPCWKSDGKTRESDTCIHMLSEMFYQTLMCPLDSTWTNVGGTASNNYTPAGYVNSNCKCNTGYYVYNGACTMTPTCESGKTWNSASGACS
jgi:hypothetical protein